MGVVDRRCNKPRQKKGMSIVTAGGALEDATVALSARSGARPARQFGSDEAGASGATHVSNATGGEAGSTVPSTGDPDVDCLREMIPHHEGAVEIARAEVASGTDPKVQVMAEAVIRTRQADITKMHTWPAKRRAAKKEAR
jgi:uncharacterized protein (DUF305 family)